MVKEPRLLPAKRLRAKLPPARPRRARLLLVAMVSGAVPATGMADVVLSSNDGHSVMDAQKTIVAPARPGPDTVTVIDVKSYPPKIKATFEAPGSVVGPPGAIWISADESWGIVTSATKADAGSKTGGISPDDRVAVFDLTDNPPKVVQSLTSGPGATQVRVSPNGTVALIANRAEGTVSVFTVKDKRLTAVGKVDTGNAKSLPSAVVFVDDKSAILSRSGDNMVNVLHVDGTNVTIDPRPITAGVGPYTMDINAAHTLAAVSNMGRGDGDADSVSLIDLTSKPYRVVGNFGVPSGPEPLRFSPDGQFLAIGAQNGSTKPAGHPFHHDNGLLGVYAVEGQSLRKVAEAPIGGWAEAVAFSRDGGTVLIQSMQDRKIEVFRWDGKNLTHGESLTVEGAGPESFATAW
jgi:DNA-binding beta-propeller fold protein YncE